MKKIIILFIISLSAILLFGQGKITNDSINIEQYPKEEKTEEAINLFFEQAKSQFTDGNYAAALPYYLAIDSLAGQYDILNEKTVRAISDRSEISRLTFTPAGVEMAKTLQLEALKEGKKLEDDEVLNMIYLRLADIYGLTGELDSTKIFTDRAYRYYKTSDNAKRLARVYLMYMNYHNEKEEFDSSAIKLKEGIAYLKTKDEPSSLASLMMWLGNYWQRDKGNCSNAIPLFEEAKDIYYQLGDTLNRNYLYLLEGLGICYGKTQNFRAAYTNYQLAYNTRREMERKRNNELTRNLESKYEADKKQKAIELLTLQKSLAEQEKLNQLYILLGLSLILLLLALVFYGLYKGRQKIARKQKELSEMKSAFFANISHEFRTPLTLIKSPLDEQLASADLSPNERAKLQMMQQSTSRLLTLVDQLLDLSKLESGNATLTPSLTPIEPFFKAIISPFYFPLEQEGIAIETSVETAIETAGFDKDVVEKIVVNLLSNALKYTPKNGEVFFGLKASETYLTIEVKNSGAGVKEEEIDKVFDRFYQADNHKEGVGIGLAMVKQLVTLHGGTIDFSSEAGSWTKFKVEIPFVEISENAPANAVTAKPKTVTELPKESGGHSKTIIEEAPALLDEKPILLIVEDNSDLRNLLENLFAAEYQIMTAVNGKEGISEAIEHIPDIIISDIMMPEADGITLCNTLKKDERTGHIPIILLTAKAGEENTLTGLESGADDYILKPFNNKLLKARVQNLIDSRLQLRARYAQEVILKPMDIAISSADEQLLDRMQKLLETQLTNPEFSAEIFSHDMGLSRMQLHRKLKALTGLSTSEFIRSQRLKMAAHILTHSHVNVSEVAYEVGFNDPSYFTKCFKSAYGTSPRDYAKQNT